MGSIMDVAIRTIRTAAALALLTTSAMAEDSEANVPASLMKAPDAFARVTAGQAPSPYDPAPHAINVWGHAQKLLNADTRLVETPNTETLYSVAIVDLKGGPVVIVHPDSGDRYFRTSIWDLHSDTHTISQKQDGGAPPPYVVAPSGGQERSPPG